MVENISTGAPRIQLEGLCEPLIKKSRKSPYMGQKRAFIAYYFIKIYTPPFGLRAISTNLHLSLVLPIDLLRPIYQSEYYISTLKHVYRNK